MNVYGVSCELFSAKFVGVAAGFGIVAVTFGRAGTKFKQIGLPRVLYGLFGLFVLGFFKRHEVWLSMDSPTEWLNV